MKSNCAKQDCTSCERPTKKTEIIPISKIIEKVLEDKAATLRPGTVDIYRTALNKFGEMTRGMNLDEINQRHFDHYKIARLKQVQATTVNMELRALRAAFQLAARWHYVDTYPFSDTSLCLIDEKDPVYFTPDEFGLLIGMIDEKWLRDVSIFGAFTGSRRDEIRNLRWDNIDLTRKTVSITNHDQFRTKSGKGRKIPLNESVFTMLERRAYLDKSDFVFLLPEGRQIGASWLSHRFKHYVRRSGITRAELHFHSLRHTFASWLAIKGVSMYKIQTLLGHKDPKTTMVYAHLSPSDLFDEVNSLSFDFPFAGDKHIC